MMRMGENETKYTIQEEEKNRRILIATIKKICEKKKHSLLCFDKIMQ